jgi:hypothetical protein
MRREWLLAALLGASGCGGHGAPEHTTGGQPTPAPTATALAVHVTSNGAGRYTVVTQMKNRRTLFTIRALSFEGSAPTDATTGGSGTFEQPHVVFRDRNRAETVADAPKAVLTGADKSVLMTGGVLARTQDGNVLRCDRLRYAGANETLHGEGHVRLDTPGGLSLVGERIDGDVRLSHVRVTR